MVRKREVQGSLWDKYVVRNLHLQLSISVMDRKGILGLQGFNREWCICVTGLTWWSDDGSGMGAPGELTNKRLVWLSPHIQTAPLALISESHHIEQGNIFTVHRWWNTTQESRKKPRGENWKKISEEYYIMLCITLVSLLASQYNPNNTILSIPREGSTL